MSSSLKQELKAWEHQFRQENGRDPNKVDIKSNVEIAKKYKEYSKSKQPTQAPIKQAAPIFKTPTKPRPSTTSRPLTTTTHGDPSTSSDALATTHENGGGGGGGRGSPTKRLSANGKTKEPQYVLANSPSKLRALAAMHSTSGSPNRPSGPNWLTASTSSSSQSSKRTKSISSQPPPPSSSSTTMNTSPRKALNPFASPKKRETIVIAPPSRGTTLFGEFEKQELDRIKREKKKKEKGIIKVKGGMGWGHSSDALEIGNGRGSRMELDEVDEFFGSPSTSSTLTKPQDSNPFLSPASALQPQSQSQLQDEEEDDELLGPSPIKPPSQFRRSISSTSFGFDSSKPFKPLFDDDPLPPPPPISTTSSQSKEVEIEMKPSVRPKLFETSLRTESVELSNSNSRGLKRTNSSTGGKKALGGGRGGDEMDGLLDDGEDDFYADAFDALEGKEGEEDSGKKGKGGKRKRVSSTAAAGRGRGRGRGGKGKGKARDEELGEEEGEVDDELRVERDGRGGLVLDLRVDGVEGEEGGEMRERIKVMQQGRDRRRRGNADGMQLDQEEGREGEEEEEDLLTEDVSFLSRPQNRSIVSSDRTRRTNSPPHPSSQPALGASLPSDLASILSLRASPTKSTETAKDRQVAKLLREPTELARQRRRGGLLELEDEQVGEENDDEEEEIEGDDDWDEEVDGWKQAGDAMDGYYSGREDW